MKAFLIFLSITCISLNAAASDDYVTWQSKYDTKYVYIDGLKVDLFQKYYIKDSKGPKWGKDLDISVKAQNREEKSFLRGFLFSDRKTTICGICNINRNNTPNILSNIVEKAPVIPSAIGYDVSQLSS